MKITRDDSEVLKIEDRHNGIVLLAAIFVVASIAQLINLASAGEQELQPYLIQLVALGIAIGAGNAFSEKSVFQFAAYERAVKWQRKKLLGHAESGLISFDDIEGVHIGTTGFKQARKYRLELVVKGGAAVPLTKVYSQGEREKCEMVGERIKVYIGQK